MTYQITERVWSNDITHVAKSRNTTAVFLMTLMPFSMQLAMLVYSTFYPQDQHFHHSVAISIFN